jgi:aspartyl-tRNA(Asn)/glutamyl-tRNA(Gln) amidotransferase subunit A
MSRKLNRRNFINQFSGSLLVGSLPLLTQAKSKKQPLTTTNTSHLNVVKPSSPEEIAFMPLHLQLALIRNKKMTCTELLDIYMERIQTVNDKQKLNCFIHKNYESAKSQATELDALAKHNSWRGPLHGAILTVKDDLDVKNFTTTCGSKSLENWQPSTDAICIAKLKQAGAVILAKTNLDEFSFGALGYNEYFGQVKNPHNLNYSPGGSSSGSAAATASGICSASIASDASGAIRVPASACGIYGFKSTIGAINQTGLSSFVPTKDAIGCMARSPQDLRLLFNTMSSTKKEMQFQIKPIHSNSIKIGYISDILNAINENNKNTFLNSIEKLQQLDFKVKPLVLGDLKLLHETGRIINFTEQSAWIEILTSERLNLQNTKKSFQNHIIKRLEFAEKISAPRYYKAKAIQKELFLKKILSVFEQVDFIALPTTGERPPLINSIKDRILSLDREIENFKFPCEVAGLLGLPAITIPQGTDELSLPHGLQIIGKPNTDNDLIDLCIFLQTKFDGYQKPKFLNNSQS